MSSSVLILHTDASTSQALDAFFVTRGDRVRYVDENTAPDVVEESAVDLLVIDLTQPQWSADLARIQESAPRAPVLFVADAETAVPIDVQQLRASVVVRRPFTDDDLATAVDSLPRAAPLVLDRSRPRVRRARIPILLKLAIPFLVLFLITWLAIRLADDSPDDERFANDVVATGQLVADEVVREEDELLANLRLIAFTADVAGALADRDAEQLRQFVLPLAVNNEVDAIELLDTSGVSVLSLRRPAGASPDDPVAYDASRGDDIFADWTFVQDVLDGAIDARGDKFGGIGEAPWGTYLYTAGPVFDENGARVGVVLVGESLTTLARRLREVSRAHIVLYNVDGQPIVATLPLDEGTNYALGAGDAAALLARPDNSLTRAVAAGDVGYSEIIGPLVVRGEVARALVGTLLATPTTTGGQGVGWPVWLFTILAFFVISGLTLYLARRSSWQLGQLAQAMGSVARGEFNVRVEPSGQDEVAVAGHNFNHMTAALREERLFRDLLGRDPSPDLRRDMRLAFRNDLLQLDGQSGIVTVLRCRLRNVDQLGAGDNARQALDQLGAFYDGVAQRIAHHDGLVSTYTGDIIVAVFGLLPRLLTPTDSALEACRTAEQIQALLAQQNKQRAAQGQSPLEVAITVSTGTVVAGAIRHGDHTRYAVIGETMAAAEQLERIALRADGSEAVVSHYTYLALGNQRDRFELAPLGMYSLRDKRLVVYRLAGQEDGRPGAAGTPEAVPLETAVAAAATTPPTHPRTGPLRVGDVPASLTGQEGVDDMVVADALAATTVETPAEDSDEAGPHNGGIDPTTAGLDDGARAADFADESE